MEPDRRVQPAGGGRSTEPGFGKRMMQVLRAVYHMLRRGLCPKRLMMDLHLLLGRGKLAGWAVRNLVAAAAHSHGAAGQLVPASSSGAAASASSSSAALSFSPDPRDVEFSCNTTPSYSPLGGAAGSLFPFRIRGRGRSAAGGRGAGKYGGLNVADVARAFEMMNAQDQQQAGASGETPSSSSPAAAAQLATPSPLLALSLGRRPAGARQLRVTDSPFPVDPEGVDERADAKADDFIKRFYQQLWLQQASATPDNSARRRA